MCLNERSTIQMFYIRSVLSVAAIKCTVCFGVRFVAIPGGYLLNPPPPLRPGTVRTCNGGTDGRVTDAKMTLSRGVGAGYGKLEGPAVYVL